MMSNPHEQSTAFSYNSQLRSANTTAASFLGSGGRLPAWLVGDAAVLQPQQRGREQEAGNCQLQKRQRKDVGRAQVREVSSTSSSPQLPNTTILQQPNLAQAALSPPFTPGIAPSSGPDNVDATQAQRIAQQQAFYPNVSLARKRKASGTLDEIAVPAVTTVASAGSSPSTMQSPHLSGGPWAANYQLLQSPVTAFAPSTASSPVVNNGVQMLRHDRSWPTAQGQFQHQRPSPQHANSPPGNRPCPQLSQELNSVRSQHAQVRRASLSGPPNALPHVHAATSATLPHRRPQQLSNLHTQKGVMPQNTQITDQRCQPSPQTRAPLPIIQPYSQIVCGSRIKQYFLERAASALPILNRYETMRLRILEQAAREDDSLYLFVHQLASITSIDPRALPRQFLEIPGFREVMISLNRLFADNACGDLHLKTFFSALPCSLISIATENPGIFQHLLRHLTGLCSRLPLGWQELQAKCLQLRIPPLASELWLLHVYSPMLQGTFFRSVMQQIWPSEINPGAYATAEQLHVEERGRLYGYLKMRGFAIDRAYLKNQAGEYTKKFTDLHHQAHESIPHGNRITTDRGRSERSGPQPSRLQAHGTPGLFQYTPVHKTPHQIVAPPTGAMNPFTSPAMPPGQPGTAPVMPSGQRLVAPAVAPDRRPPPQTPTLIPHDDAPVDLVTVPTWRMSALHQAQLRGPCLAEHVEVGQGDAEAVPLYQFVESFVIAPRRLEPGQLVSTFEFDIQDWQFDRIPRTQAQPDSPRPLRVLKPGAQQYRLRMVKVGPLITTQPESLDQNWLVRATTFHQYIYFVLNEEILEVRRKMHHTKDFPVDITQFIRKGTNRFEIYVTTEPDDKTIAEYAFAIESVEVIAHDAILQRTEECVESAEASLRSITASLSNGEHDDDIIVDNVQTNINIYDPITQSAICTLPVRGRDCKHRDCFDLHTFLQTRTREEPHWPSEVDVWKCPICLGDVRPHLLIVDGFLKEVGIRLRHEDKGGVRAIEVFFDGSWKPKKQAEGLSLEQSTHEPGPNQAAEARPAKRPEAEVIDLSMED